MNETIRSVRALWHEIEQDLEARLAASRKSFHYAIENGKAVFTEAALRRHQRLKKSLKKTFADARLRNLAAAPFIYAAIIPIAILDAFVSLYQTICFRLWDIPRVRRADHVIVDRHRLPYLNVVQKLNCAYCGYANGVMAYASEIAGRTEQYWCPIKHAFAVKRPHSRYVDFIDYGDAENLQARIVRQRNNLRRDCADEESNDRVPICETPSDEAAPSA